MCEWISVKDRLPEDSQEVLVWNREPGKRYPDDDAVQLGIFGAESRRFYVHDGYYEMDSGTITHWMPLPEGPEEKQLIPFEEVLPELIAACEKFIMDHRPRTLYVDHEDFSEFETAVAEAKESMK